MLMHFLELKWVTYFFIEAFMMAVGPRRSLETDIAVGPHLRVKTCDRFRLKTIIISETGHRFLPQSLVLVRPIASSPRPSCSSISESNKKEVLYMIGSTHADSKIGPNYCSSQMTVVLKVFIFTCGLHCFSLYEHTREEIMAESLWKISRFA